MFNEPRRYEQLCSYLEQKKNLPVQAFINSIAFPKDFDEIIFFMRDIHYFNMEEIVSVDEAEWSVPRWCKKGDIVLFMHTVSSRQTIHHLRTVLKKTNLDFSEKNMMYIQEGLDRGEQIYNKYGGKVFAIGVVTGNIKKYKGGKRCFAEISHILQLNRPIDYSEFRHIQKLSTSGAITPVYDSKYEFIKRIIEEDTQLPAFIARSKSSPIRESDINRHNWIEMSQKYRFRYTLESQFRAGFVDYLLKELADRHKIYEECHTSKSTGETGYVDNVIRFNGYLLPVEVKLDVNLEVDLIGQVSKYCEVDEMLLDNKKGYYAPLNEIYPGRVLVIDTFRIYMYYHEKRAYQEIYDLWDFTGTDELETLRSIIQEKIGHFEELPEIAYETRTRLNFAAQRINGAGYLTDEANVRILETEAEQSEHNPADYTNNQFAYGSQRVYRREQYDLDRYAVNNPDIDHVLQNLSDMDMNENETI